MTSQPVCTHPILVSSKPYFSFLGRRVIIHVSVKTSKDMTPPASPICYPAAEGN